MELAKKYNDIQWEEEVVYGTKMLVSEPLAMASAAGWSQCLLIGLRNICLRKMHLNY